MKLDNIIRKIKDDMSLAQVHKAVAGKIIGVGQYRDVYALKGNSNYVIKFHRFRDDGRFCNVTEYVNYNNCNGLKLQKWLAPVEACAENGLWLIMARTTPIKKLPNKIPSALYDLKPENFGMYKGRVVCHDYPWLAIRDYRLISIK